MYKYINNKCSERETEIDEIFSKNKNEISAQSNKIKGINKSV